jgi:membrane associated rhomboid family serine protease
MDQATANPFEVILRLCAAAAPGPWYPRVYAKNSGTDFASLRSYLEELLLDDLLVKVPGSAETGPGLLLTPAGRRVLESPDALRHLRDGRPAFPADRGEVVRHSLRRPVRPVVTRVLLWVNLAVFGYSTLLAYRYQVGSAFLTYRPGAQQNLGVALVLREVMRDSGGVNAEDIIQRRWWRLLTATFVQLGLLHLALNMLGLVSAGRVLEQMWGHGRYLAIYLFAALAGSCLGVAFYVQSECVGASGALCGLLGAAAVWVLFNGRYLPRSVLRRLLLSLGLSFVILAVLSGIPGVSAWGHFGGVLAGAAAALLLHGHRCGPSPWRWLLLAGFVPLAWAGLAVLDRARATDPRWRAAERSDFEQHYQGLAGEALRKAGLVFANLVQPVLEQHPTRRDPEKVEKALADLAPQEQKLAELIGQLTKAGPYRNQEVDRLRRDWQQQAEADLRRLARAEHCLRGGEKWDDRQRPNGGD